MTRLIHYVLTLLAGSGGRSELHCHGKGACLLELAAICKDGMSLQNILGDPSASCECAFAEGHALIVFRYLHIVGSPMPQMVQQTVGVPTMILTPGGYVLGGVRYVKHHKWHTGLSTQWAK